MTELLDTPIAALLHLGVLLVGWFVSTWVAGRLLGRFLQRFTDQDATLTEDGLADGGFWIGLGERTLIYLFVIIGEPAGIGFLAAAKSIFRIGEVKERDQRRLAEYILIGTLMSFALAIVVGLATREILSWI